jgi:gamma-glutamyl-gamma-aminobutyraldehyde dehydrogenase
MTAPTLTLRSPADGTVLGETPITSAAEVHAAARRADEIFRSRVWRVERPGSAPRCCCASPS